MNKLFTFVLGTAFSLLVAEAFAQNKLLNPVPKYTGNNIRSSVLSSGMESDAPTNNSYPKNKTNAITVLWSENFSGGIPSSWKVSGPNPIWKYTSKGSTGPYSAGTSAIKSTTATNGFIIFDADSASTSPYPDLTGAITTSKINLTGYPNVRLRFQQYYRLFYYGAASVFVSNDSSAWTKYSVYDPNLYNASSSNPELVDLDISSVAGNKSSVYVKFEFDSTSHYFWQIDDIEIITDYNFEMSMETPYIWEGTENFFCRITPKSQIAPYQFRGAVYNSGIQNLTNARLNADVYNISTSSTVFNQASPTPKTLNAKTRDTLIVGTTYTPADTGSYLATFVVMHDSTEENPLNDSAWYSFRVHDSIYARDNGIYTGYRTGNANFGDTIQDGFVYGNEFEITAPDTVTSISFRIADTKPGMYVRGVIYTISSGFNQLLLTEGSAFHQITKADSIAGWVTLPITDPIASKILPVGYYLVAVEMLSSTGKAYIAVDIYTYQPAQTTFFFRAADQTWYYNDQGIPMIRMNFGHQYPVGIEEAGVQNGISLFQNIPNPSSAFTVISYELEKASEVSIEVCNLLGEKVYEQSKKKIGAGKHTLQLDTHQWPAGIYYYTLRSGENMITKKMTVSQ